MARFGQEWIDERQDLVCRVYPDFLDGLVVVEDGDGDGGRKREGTEGHIGRLLLAFIKSLSALPLRFTTTPHDSTNPSLAPNFQGGNGGIFSRRLHVELELLTCRWTTPFVYGSIAPLDPLSAL
jgi:hypothetical protein